MGNSLPPSPESAQNQFYEIEVVVTRQEKYILKPTAVSVTLSLKQLLDKYTFTLGYQNVHLQEVLIALMTSGKVHVEFRDFDERLQLKDPAKMIGRYKTMELFAGYLESIKVEKKVTSTAEMTRRIIVQSQKTSPSSPLQ